MRVGNIRLSKPQREKYKTMLVIKYPSHELLGIYSAPWAYSSFRTVRNKIFSFDSETAVTPTTGLYVAVSGISLMPLRSRISANISFSCVTAKNCPGRFRVSQKKRRQKIPRL